MSKKATRKSPRPKASKTTGSSTEMMMLQNRVEALQKMLGTAMAQTTALETKLEETARNLQNAININWNKFFFHDHRRMDVAGPQFYSDEYEKVWIEERERQQAAKAIQEQELPTPPDSVPRPPEPKKADDSEHK